RRRPVQGGYQGGGQAVQSDSRGWALLSADNLRALPIPRGGGPLHADRLGMGQGAFENDAKGFRVRHPYPLASCGHAARIRGVGSPSCAAGIGMDEATAMSDPTLIRDLIAAGVSAELVSRVADALAGSRRKVERPLPPNWIPRSEDVAAFREL